jgi:hypothetical protein
MSDMRRRLKKAEEELGLDKKPVTIEILRFGISVPELPPDRTYGELTIHFAWFDLNKHKIAAKADPKKLKAEK